jgi:drug/metabolite transporter (DMT)-like permease
MAALSYAVMTMMTRKLGMRDSAGALTFYIQVSFPFISLAVGLAIGDGSFDRHANPSASFLLRAWRWPDQSQIQLLLLCGFMVTFGGYLLSQAYRLGEASAVAPFEYASMPFALLIGFYLWGDWPDSIAFVGSGLIIFGGLLVILLEHRTTRTPVRATHTD